MLTTKVWGFLVLSKMGVSFSSQNQKKKLKNCPLISNLNLRKKTKLESWSPMNEHEESSPGPLSRDPQISFGKYWGIHYSSLHCVQDTLYMVSRRVRRIIAPYFCGFTSVAMIRIIWAHDSDFSISLILHGMMC
jgi:hypothetical protein